MLMGKEKGPSLSELSDEELMRRYMLGEVEAFNELYRRHSPRIYGYLKKKLAMQAAADDVFQEVFLRLHRFRGRYDPTIPFLPWLFTVARNAIIDHQRRQRTIAEHEQPEQASLNAMVAASVATEPSALLHSYLENLSDREKEILTLHLQEGFSFREIAASLRISSSNARKLSSRAIQKLRSIWK